MLVTILKSRLENACLTGSANPVQGAIIIDQDVLEAAGICVGEKVDIYNVRTGLSQSAPVASAPRGSRSFLFDGGQAQAGDRVTIIAWSLMGEPQANNFDPVVIAFDDDNRVDDS
jgi:aspartate 1-decarboxylase